MRGWENTTGLAWYQRPQGCGRGEERERALRGREVGRGGGRELKHTKMKGHHLHTPSPPLTCIDTCQTFLGTF